MTTTNFRGFPRICASAWRSRPQAWAISAIVAFACGLLTTRGLARESKPLPIPDIPYEKVVLSNGLTVIVHEDHKAPIVTVNVWYHVGSKNEPPNKTGFAHLFEHLMFNGSQHYNDDYFKPFDQVGATELNGTTNDLNAASLPPLARSFVSVWTRTTGTITPSGYAHWMYKVSPVQPGNTCIPGAWSGS